MVQSSADQFNLNLSFDPMFFFVTIILLEIGIIDILYTDL